MPSENCNLFLLLRIHDRLPNMFRPSFHQSFEILATNKTQRFPKITHLSICIRRLLRIPLHTIHETSTPKNPAIILITTAPLQYEMASKICPVSLGLLTKNSIGWSFRVPNPGLIWQMSDYYVSISPHLPVSSHRESSYLRRDFLKETWRKHVGPPSRVLPSHFRLVSGAGAATPFSIYIGAPALINLAHQSVSKQCLHICDKTKNIKLCDA